MFHKKNGYLMSLGLGFALSSPVFSQVTLDPTLVVTANKYYEETKNVPAAITVITAGDIKDSGISSVNEAIMKIGGVIGRPSQYGGAEYSLDLLGVGDTASSNQVIVIDGVPYKDGDTSETRISNLSVDQIERIEIQRGASSVLYGQGAVGGVINIITKASAPTGSDSKSYMNVAAGMGSYGTELSKTNGSYYSGGLSLNFSAKDQTSSGYRTNSASKDGSLSLSGQYKTTDYRFGMYVDTNNSYSLFPGALTSTAQFYADPTQLGNNPLGTWGSYRGTRYGIFAETDLLNTNIRADLSQRLKEYNSNLGGSLYSAMTVSNFMGLTATKSVTTSIGLNKLVAGYEISNWNQSRSYGDQVISNSSAYFFKNDLDINSVGLRLTAGYRSEASYKADSSTPASNAGAINAWELGASKALDKSNNFYVRLARSIRFGNADEFTSYAPNGNLVNLLPQTSIDKEIGWKYKKLDEVSFNLRIYQSDFNNEIGYDPINYYSFNYDPTRRQGVDLNGTYKILPTLTMAGSVGLKNATFVSGQYVGNNVPMSPSQTANARLYWKVATDQTTMLGVNWVSSQYIFGDFANTQTMPSYSTVDFRYAYKLSQVELALDIKNVLDKSYYSYATVNSTYPIGIYPDPRRSLFVTAKINFN